MHEKHDALMQSPQLEAGSPDQLELKKIEEGHSQQLKDEEVQEEEQEGVVLLQSEFEDLNFKVSERKEAVISALHTAAGRVWSQWHRLKLLAGLAGLLAFAAFFLYAMWYEQLGTDGSVRLLIMTAAGVLFAAYRTLPIKPVLQRAAGKLAVRIAAFRAKNPKFCRVAAVLAFALYFCGFVLGFGAQNARNLVSAAGMLLVLLIAIIISAHPTKISWRPVLGGLGIQVTFAFLMIRTAWGFAGFKYIADRVAEFITHVDAASSFIFGQDFRQHFFAFSVLPVVVFFSSVISLLFHLEILQAIISTIGRVMQAIMNTTAGESLVAAANIFIGQTEAPLLIRPIAGRMTNSELHTVMASGFATIAGGVMAAYIGLGVPAEFLLSASIMAAPAALALSKIVYPETKKTRTDRRTVGKIKMAHYHSSLDAIASGAMDSIAIVSAIAANLIAFISLLSFVNQTLTWLGQRVGFASDLTFELICSYILWPVAYLIGIDNIDCSTVAELIGTKFFINEFIAYEKFSKMRKNFERFTELQGNGTNLVYSYNRTHLWFESIDEVLSGGILFQPRSITLVTFALCGFGNLSSVGLQIGFFCTMLPRRKADIVGLVLRAVFTGTLANLLTASMAGIFYQSAG